MHKFFYFIFLVSFLLSLQGCTNNIRSNQTLKVGISPWPGYEPLALASKKGFYGNDHNIRVIRFSQTSESFKALRNGLIDVAAFTADELLYYAEVIKNPQILMILDISNGGDAIIAQKDINSLDELHNKIVGYDGNAPSYYLINRSLDFANKLSMQDLKLVKSPIGTHYNALLSGELDAVVTYEPCKSRLQSEGMNILFDSSQIPNEIIDVLVTNKDTITNKRELLESLTAGWFKALEFIKNNKQEALTLMASFEDVNIAEFNRSFSQLSIPTHKESIGLLEGNSTISHSLHKLNTIMYDKKLLTKKVDIEPIFNSSIIKSSVAK